AFAGPPSLFVAAHEAAHIVQQRSGLVSEGAVGAPGDRLERQADGVAAAVVAGASVEGMLGAPGPAASAEAVQCYFLGNEVFNRSPSIPAGARISENGKLVLLGKQQLVATEGAIDTANAALEENSMVLMGRGDKVDIGFDLPPDADGMQTIVFDDYYEVRPRMNPETMNPHDPAHALSPAHGDDDEVIAAKHLAYMKRLDDVERDLAKLVVDAAGSKVFKTKEAARKADAWAEADAMRSELLKLQVFPIFRSFEGHKDREKLVADLEDLQARLHQFVLGEMLQTDAILLPNDCATCVSEMVGDHTRRTRDDSLYAAPEIGSNYYTGLPKPKHAALGWNFHWAGVVMADGSDRATLESAGGLSFGSRDKATWWFNLYGTRVADQTFKK
ncbi:MAG TPA: hypothetical protein PKW90_25370, partial [Myxococcota bacterium]|nr:hypothetical protein [Myxococcota bacterium]